MFYRFINQETLEVTVSPDIRYVCNAVINYRRHAKDRLGYYPACIIDYVEGNYCNDTASPSARIAYEFPATKAIN